MRRNIRQRTAACLLALLAQTGLIALFVHSPVRQVAHEDDSKRLIFIQPVQLPEIVPPRPDRTLAAGRTNSSVMITERARSESVEPPEPPRAITVPPGDAPRIDWYGAMESAARSAAERAEERELHGSPENSKPQILVIPERPHMAGDEERYDDGTVVTWLSERCYVILDRLEPRPMRVCKTPTLAERRREANRKEREKAMKPEYLGRPLPMPDPPPSRDGSPATDPSNR